MQEKFLVDYNNEDKVYNKKLDPRCKSPVEVIKSEEDLKKSICKPLTLEDKIVQEIHEYHGEVTSSSNFGGDTEQIELLIGVDMLPAVHEDGAILTDKNGNIILRY